MDGARGLSAVPIRRGAVRAASARPGDAGRRLNGDYRLRDRLLKMIGAAEKVIETDTRMPGCVSAHTGVPHAAARIRVNPMARPDVRGQNRGPGQVLKRTDTPAMTRSTLPNPPAARAAAVPDAPSMHALHDRRYSPTKLAVLVDVASALGVDAAVVLDGTGLDAAAVADPFTLTSSLQFVTAARNAIRAYDGTDLGVRVGSRLHASSYGMYGYALLCSTSLAHTFDSAVKYHQLANRVLAIRWVEHDGIASWLFPDPHEVALPDLDTALYRFLIDLQFAVHVTIIKDVMGAWCVPARAHFAQPRPPHAALLADVLECPIAFDQPRHALGYPSAWLARAPQLANPITAAQVSSQCARLLDELRSQADVTRRVYQELTRTPGQFPDIDAIADSLCITSRTLRRKLEAEGTSYSALLTSVRKALAIDYLSTTTLSIDDIASTLGFSDAVGFRHAFKRWTGTTPSDVRRKRGR